MGCNPELYRVLLHHLIGKILPKIIALHAHLKNTRLLAFATRNVTFFFRKLNRWIWLKVDRLESQDFAFFKLLKNLSIDISVYYFLKVQKMLCAFNRHDSHLFIRARTSDDKDLCRVFLDAFDYFGNTAF